MKRRVYSLLSIAVSGIIAACLAGGLGSKQVNEIRKTSDKHLALFFLMNQWVKIKQENKKVSSYFTENKYQRIAIYGMSYVGRTLINELQNSDVEVVCGIDQRKGIYSDFDVVTIDEFCEEVDVIVVTAITFFDDIKEKLGKKVSCPVVSLEDIIYGL